MQARSAIVEAAFAAALIVAESVSPSVAQPPASTDMAPPPDYAAELRRALDRALADGSNGALIMFIARNPDDALTHQARQALAARSRPDPEPWPGPDGEIVAAFDRARLAGPAALAAFAAAFATHPLGAEARRPFWQ